MPPGVVTVTSTVPVPAGLSAVIVVSSTTRHIRRRRRAEVNRRRTREPRAGDRHQSTAGRRTAGRAHARHRRRRSRRVCELIGRTDVADVPAGVVTVTSTMPVPAGLSAVIVVSLTTVKFVAAVVPKFDRRRAGESTAADRHQTCRPLRTAGRAQARRPSARRRRCR